MKVTSKILSLSHIIPARRCSDSTAQHQRHSIIGTLELEDHSISQRIMSKDLCGVPFWLAFLALFSLFSPTSADYVTIPISGEGTAMYDDSLNPGQPYPAPHDVYYRERCFCEPDRTWPKKSPSSGAYFHIEYFNHFHQLYFSLEFICKTDTWVNPKDDDSCMPSFRPEESLWFYKHQSFAGCAINNATGYQWCYEATRNHMTIDTSFIGDKERQIGYTGSPLLEDRAAVLNECERLCREMVDPGLTVYKPWNPDRTLNENIIDYCDAGDWDDHW